MIPFPSDLKSYLAMSSQLLYIDLHTHHALPSTDRLWRLRSLRWCDPLPSDTPFSLGLHPWYVEDMTDEARARLEAVARGQLSLYAIGEAGLDRLSSVPLSLQEHYFIKQIELSESCSLPLIIHCVRAWSELLALRARIKTTMPWIVHGFRGRRALAEQLLSSGCLLSFGRYYQPDSLRLAHERSCLFLETDEADLAIEELYAQAATLLGLTEQELCISIVETARRVWPRGD